MRGTIIFWLSMLLATPALAQSAFLDAERARLRTHFDEVLAELEAVDTSALSVEQRARRARHLVRLAEYRDRGEFPQRYSGPAGRVPEFRDVHGTRCAMGELIYLSGETQLVDDVATTANSATIAELSADPRLTRWLGENGLTVEEAGRVQPTYDFPPANCLCAPVDDTLWKATANDEATQPIDAEGFHVVEVELLEHLAGADTRTVGQLETVRVRFAAPQGQGLLVSFIGESGMAYPSSGGDATVACSTASTALGDSAFSTTCRADTQVAFDVAVEAMQLPYNECSTALGSANEVLTRGCWDDGIVDGGVDGGGIDGGADGGVDGGTDNSGCTVGGPRGEANTWLALCGVLVWVVSRRRRTAR